MTDRCPKCQAPRPGGPDDEACPRCGVVYARFDPAVLEEGVPESLRALWRDLEENWNDRARHALFLERAVASGRAGYAAAMYRRRGDDPVARECLDRLVARLDQILAAAASPPGRAASSRRAALAILLVAAIAAAAVAVLLVRWS